MEEDIKRVKDFINKTAIYYIGMPTSLTNILNQLERLQKENTQLRKGQQSLMQSRKKWKDRYYKEKRKNKELKEFYEKLEQEYNILLNMAVATNIAYEDSIPKTVIQDKIEVLANLEHERWAKWQEYVHSLCIKNEDGSLTIPKERVEHWNYEISTKYDDLPENIKEYDRQEIRLFLEEILKGE